MASPTAAALAAGVLASALLFYVFGPMGILHALLWACFGSFLGWLGSLVTASDTQQAILLDMLTGAVGAVGALLIFGGGSLTEGGPMERAFSSILGSVLLVTARSVYRHRLNPVRAIRSNRLEPDAGAGR
jgi:uncharacterized membrane protein YeaQ/YmgE (transglycosylase-associated protein family)